MSNSRWVTAAEQVGHRGGEEPTRSSTPPSFTSSRMRGRRTKTRPPCWQTALWTGKRRDLWGQRRGESQSQDSGDKPAHTWTGTKLMLTNWKGVQTFQFIFRAVQKLPFSFFSNSFRPLNWNGRQCYSRVADQRIYDAQLREDLTSRMFITQ